MLDSLSCRYSSRFIPCRRFTAAKSSTPGRRCASDPKASRLKHSSLARRARCQAEKLLSEGKVDITPIISHDLPMSEYDKAHKVRSSCWCMLLMSGMHYSFRR